ncbi:hypothetical protein A4H97_13750 [Niastella yeongjuensis]|uniref:Effector-associated domain-containing protein n=1 Tax=Niastella yeongjuensis TaxID=354355 RepID=A0A1V9E3H9_9BACT|nr:SIR2 family protein [Niastella yeongjuensis]OQP40683.1 hypothetical protein A4H97_13750 [Niastella yeongjuensis]SEP04689.1 SIR2-like domain-containing protein [Niastella yeongjuensis]
MTETTVDNLTGIRIDWEDLYRDLKDHRAILALGPEFYSSDGLSPKEKLYQHLIKKPDHGILHFYPNNGIFLFQSPKYKSYAQRDASEYYKTIEPEPEELPHIMDLPFRMIINTSPSQKLFKKYKERIGTCQFDYFSWNPHKKYQEISDPDRNTPLIYNLFGSTEHFESLVLDFEDIFDHLKSLLNNVNVPDTIRSVLNETDTFIFIGFHLQKMDTQLLFRYLNMKEHCFDDRKKNYTTRSFIDDSSESFFCKQFNIKYYGAPVEFIREMHKSYFESIAKEDNYMIRQTSIKKLIYHYIEEDNIDRPLDILTLYTIKNETEINDQLILIKSNYSRYNYLSNKRLERFDVLEIERTKIKARILELLNNLPD